MIDEEHPLPKSRQAEVLEISRSSLYYVPVPLPQADLDLMRIIDKLHTEYPFAGARMLRDMLKQLGYEVGRRFTASGKEPRPTRPTRNTRICCEISSSIGRIRRGPRISATFRCATGFSTFLRYSTGTLVKCWRGGSRTV